MGQLRNTIQTWSGKRLDGQFYGHFHIQSYQQEIQRAYMFVNTEDSNIKGKDMIREEITQSLGFFNDTYDYPESIFYQGYSERTSFASIDEKSSNYYINSWFISPKILLPILHFEVPNKKGRSLH